MKAKPKTAAEWEGFSRMLGDLFTPSSPIDQRDLFAGRIEQLESILEALATKGQHVIVYGERGVGKTSLMRVVKVVSGMYTVVLNCSGSDSYAKLWQRAFEEVRFEQTHREVGFGAGRKTRAASLAESLVVEEGINPDRIVAKLRALDVPILFAFDEFDRLSNKATTRDFADTIKALSDFAVPAKIALVGVGDDVQSLLQEHQSVERALVQVAMPRMTNAELANIIANVVIKVPLKFEDAVSQRIVQLAQGLPQFVHLLCLHSSRHAANRHSLVVTQDDLRAGIEKSVAKSPESILSAYAEAVSSPQRDNLFQEVLLACALAPVDMRGSFAPKDVRSPLRKIAGRRLEIPAFAAHLNKFASDDRGNILKKFGESRRFRYRFSNPLMPPYVVMRGLADRVIDDEMAVRAMNGEDE